MGLIIKTLEYFYVLYIDLISRSTERQIETFEISRSCRILSRIIGWSLKSVASMMMVKLFHVLNYDPVSRSCYRRWKSLKPYNRADYRLVLLYKICAMLKLKWIKIHNRAPSCTTDPVNKKFRNSESIPSKLTEKITKIFHSCIEFEVTYL